MLDAIKDQCARLMHGAWLLSVVLLSACSATKFVPDNEYLLTGVEIRSDVKDFDVSSLEPYIRQRANSKWFSTFKIPLVTYALSGRDTTKWINRTLQKIGEKPVLFDTMQARLSCEDLRKAMQNMGYMHAQVELDTRVRGKKIRAYYTLYPHEPYRIRSVEYDIQDRNIAQMLELDKPENQGLSAGDRFTVDRLDAERKRLTQILQNNGYYRFHKDFIQYSADSARNENDVNLTLHLMRYRAAGRTEELDHPQYFVRQVNFLGADGDGLHLRRNVLETQTAIRTGAPFSAGDLQQTYHNFSKLQAVRFTNIAFKEVPDTTLLDCDIQITTHKPSTISIQPEGTNTAGNLGAALSLTYENRNLFRGSELLSIRLRAAFEAITGLEGYQNQDYEEYGLEANLKFPRFVAPFLSTSFKRRSNATSEWNTGYNLQNRPEFHRRVFSSAWRYRWTGARHHISYRLDLIDLNYVYMPWISSTFKRDYLDNVTSRNAILRYNYEDLFIMKLGFGFSFNNGNHAIRANVETAGNLLNGFSGMFGMKKNGSGKYTLFNIAFAQYAKGDIDYTRLFRMDRHNTLALHAGLGMAYPYGNSTVLPFEKRYFSGGANSVRGWSVRGLGPGKFKGSDGRIDFINQTGDVKLDLNVEYRTYLFWKFNGALFVDAGNIWTLRAYKEQEGGQFKLDEFYKQIAAAYGVGLRLNFDYFVLRFDAGMKAVNPAYETTREHYPIVHPKLSRDFAFHFAVGLPF